MRRKTSSTRGSELLVPKISPNTSACSFVSPPAGAGFVLTAGATGAGTGAGAGAGTGAGAGALLIGPQIAPGSKVSPSRGQGLLWVLHWW